MVSSLWRLPAIAMRLALWPLSSRVAGPYLDLVHSQTYLTHLEDQPIYSIILTLDYALGAS